MKTTDAAKKAARECYDLWMNDEWTAADSEFVIQRAIDESQQAEIDRLKAELADARQQLFRAGDSPLAALGIAAENEAMLRAELAKVTAERDALSAHSWHMNEKPVERNPDCACAACNPRAWWMVVCSICGNKRCPHAENHIYECTGSNEPNQPKTTLGPKPPTAAAR